MSRLSKFYITIVVTVISVFFFSLHTFAADANPFEATIKVVLGDMKKWILALVGVVTTIVVVKDGIKYQGGTSDEKNEAIKSIRNHLAMGAGIFFLAWLAMWVFQKFSTVPGV